jgi:membrane fusion protein (multidrug efflux system)
MTPTTMKSRKSLFWLFTLTAVIALAAARMLSAPKSPSDGMKSSKGGKESAGAQDAQGANGVKGGSQKQSEVSILVLKAQPLARQVQSSGTLLAREEVDLKTEMQGRITAVHFKEGTKVKKGALLVKLNDAEIRAQLGKLNTQLKLADAKESRQAALFSKDLISKEENEIAHEEMSGLLSDRDLLKAQLAKTEILAPFDGVVGLKDVSEGSNVAAGTRIAGLFSLDPLKIDFSIPEQYFGQVKAGDTVLITVEGLPNPVKGSVYAVEPKVDPATRMLRIRGYCPNGEGRIPPGASARVQLPLKTIPNAIMVPSMAVIPNIKGQTVMLYKGGKAAMVSVTAGYRTEDKIQIEGVSGGDTLIVSGLIQLKSGNPVKLAASAKPDDAPNPDSSKPAEAMNRVPAKREGG